MINGLRFDFPGVPGPTRRALPSAAIVAAAVFFACLVGIWTRPIGFLAMFWPANAVMLGLLIRVPGAAVPIGWAAGAIAFMAADLLTGSSLSKALILNGANVAGVMAAYLVYMRTPIGRTGLRLPESMLYLLLSAAAGGAVAGIVGDVANPVLVGGSVLSNWTFWFATEFVNYVAILPVILSAPAWSDLRGRLLAPPALRKADILPVAALAVSLAAAAIIGGPGALAFPVPVLLWCGLVYPIFPTAVLTLLFGMWTLLVISGGYVPSRLDDKMAVTSFRLGVSLIAIAPIVLACVMQSRNDLLARLHSLAIHDSLTGLFNRMAFREKSRMQLTKASRSIALMMIDLDRFKTVNDTYGHAAGDKVLVTFAQRMRTCLRAEDVLGRLGGEEFAVFISDCTQDQILTIAERIRSASREPIALGGGAVLEVTTSMGVVIVDPLGDPISLDALLHGADTMLYRAKSAGRDRVEVSRMPLSDAPSNMPDSSDATAS